MHNKKNAILAILILIPGLSFVSPLIGQEKKEIKNFSIIKDVQPVPEHLKAGFESITRKDSEVYLRFLASDLLEGRVVASKGYDIAAEYVATMFRLWGLRPAGDKRKNKKERGFFQDVPGKEILNEENEITVEYRMGGLFKYRTFSPEVDYNFRSRSRDSFSAPVVFVGYGINEKDIKYNSYKKIDIKGKIVIMLTGAPGRDNPASPFNKKEKLKKKYFINRYSIYSKARVAGDKGAAAIIFVESEPGKNPGVSQKKLDSRKINEKKPIFPGKRRRFAQVQPTQQRGTYPPGITVSGAMADTILGYAGYRMDTLKSEIEKNFKPRSFVLPGVSMKIKVTVEEKLVRSRNVLAYIEGADPELKEEVVVIGAHLDHVGRRGDYIFNGADDNGSGSSAVLEIAQAFALNKVKPKRSVLFALWTGEEGPLLGSRYYVTHPFFPLKKTIAYINLDMVSREWDLEEYVKWQKRFGVELPEKLSEMVNISNFSPWELSRSPEILDTLKKNNSFVGLHIHFRQSDRVGGGSDHAAFGYHRLPWVCSFGAITEDYHQPTDSVDKVSFNLIEKSARLMWLTAFSLADHAARGPS